jgi:hypothetical protein
MELNSKIFRDEVSIIQRKFGRYLLFASSFGNLQNPVDTISISAVPPNPTNDLNPTAQMKNFRNFKQAIEIFRKWDADASIPTIIVRPHPSERISIWKKELRELKKTFVVQGGQISPWVLASEGVVQHRSTVSMEAFLAGKPVFALVLDEKNQANQNGWLISKYLLDENSKTLDGNFEEVKLNPDYDPELMHALLQDFNTSSTDSILKIFDQFLSKPEKRHSTLKLILSQINLFSLRRALGLVRDEIYWKLRKTNINSQSNFVPGGLDVKSIKKVVKADTEFTKVRFRRMSINLWEFDI